jgi:putative PIN family toxin of toxin-antitoxin system
MKRKKIRIIIDTNLFISFLIGKRLKGLKNSLVENKFELIYTSQILEELRIVTQRPYFRKFFIESDVLDLIDFVQLIGIEYELGKEPDVCRDPKDNFLLGLSEISKANYLVTGDSDLLVIGKFNLTEIINYSEFEKIL